MARFKQLPARVASVPARLKQLPKHTDKFYLSRAWKDLREQKRAQGNVRCCVCGQDRGKLILDHRVERRDGGADLPALDQLDWYCIADHNRKTAFERAQRAQGNR